MPFVSITRLKLNSLFKLPAFLRANEASVQALTNTQGFLGGKELIDKGLTFWTLTLWREQADMLSFRNSPAHRKAMQNNLPSWCNEASYFHWIQESIDLPNWSEASQRLRTEGKLTKVRWPSRRQIENSFPPIKWTKLAREFKVKVN